MRKSPALVVASLLAASLCLSLCTRCGKKPDSLKPINPVVGDPGDHDSTTEECLAEWEESRKAPRDTGGTLRIGESAEAQTLNPLAARTTTDSMVASLVFSSLLHTLPTFAHGFSHGPMLAKSWEFSDDHLELTFHLRNDVLWHDGVKFTAHDVKFSHDLMVNDDFAFRSKSYKKYIDKCVAVDDYTVKFVFTKAYPAQLLDAAVGMPVPRHILGKVPPGEIRAHAFSRHPVGNGPFRFKEWKSQSHIELVANDKYFDGRPSLDRIIFKIIPDETSRIQRLQAGDIDIVSRVPWEYHKELYKNADLVPHILRDRVYYFIAWNNVYPLFKSRNVRRALTMAIQREKLAKLLFGDYGEVCEGPISPIHWAHNPNARSPAYNIEEARRLLREEGWVDSDQNGVLDKDGVEFSFVLKTKVGDKVKQDTARYVQSMLKDVGIEVRIDPVQEAALTSQVIQKNFQAVVAGWFVALKVDMTAVWHSDSVEGQTYNYVSYANPELDAVNDEALFELDHEKAKQLWWRAQEIIVADQPYTFLFSPWQANFVHKRFQNVRMKAIGWYYNIEHWWVPKDQQLFPD